MKKRRIVMRIEEWDEGYGSEMPGAGMLYSEITKTLDATVSHDQMPDLIAEMTLRLVQNFRREVRKNRVRHPVHAEN